MSDTSSSEKDGSHAPHSHHHLADLKRFLHVGGRKRSSSTGSRSSTSSHLTALDSGVDGSSRSHLVDHGFSAKATPTETSTPITGPPISRTSSSSGTLPSHTPTSDGVTDVRPIRLATQAPPTEVSHGGANSPPSLAQIVPPTPHLLVDTIGGSDYEAPARPAVPDAATAYRSAHDASPSRADILHRPRSSAPDTSSAEAIAREPATIATPPESPQLLEPAEEDHKPDNTGDDVLQPTTSRGASEHELSSGPSHAASRQEPDTLEAVNELGGGNTAETPPAGVKSSTQVAVSEGAVSQSAVDVPVHDLMPTTSAQLPPPELTRFERTLDVFDDVATGRLMKTYDTIEDDQSEADQVSAALGEVGGAVDETMAKAPDPTVRLVANTISSWAERSQALMAALDTVAKLHPVVAVAVMAFKTAVTLELQRRDNDSRIGVLRWERLEMISLLLELQEVTEKAAIEDYSRSLDTLMKTLAGDIADCARVCEQYLHSRFIVKFVHSTAWSTQLKGVSTRYKERKADLHLALQLHASKVLNRATKLISDGFAAMQGKMEMLLSFTMTDNPTERDILQYIRAKGGPEVVAKSDKLLREIINKFPSAPTTSGTRGRKDMIDDDTRAGSGKERGSENDANFKAVKREVEEGIETMLMRERKVFERKFQVQREQLLKDMSNQMTRESDRVIDTLTAGPGDRIKDKIVHNLWKEMGWKTSVKTRRFVHALRDFYRELDGADYKEPRTTNSTESAVDRNKVVEYAAVLPENDKWALVYMGFRYLPWISEAIDEDASGFVTVHELNRFTSSRPIDWSLPHWVAFWAVGWHLSMSVYIDKLNDTLSAMLKLAQNVRMPNRGRVDRYLKSYAFERINRVLTSLSSPWQESDDLLDHFQKYITDEEKRLETALHALAYEIDALNTLSLVTGPGRLERALLPLVYLVLTRHWRLIELSTREAVSEDEFLSAVRTLECIVDGIFERVAYLQEAFEQQNLEVGAQFAQFAHGLYDHYANDDKHAAWARTEEYPSMDAGSDESLFPPAPLLAITDLRYGSGVDNLHLDSYDLLDESDASVHRQASEAPPHVSPDVLTGWWDGYVHAEDDGYCYGRISFHLAIGSDEQVYGHGIGGSEVFAVTRLLREPQDSQHDDVVLRLDYGTGVDIEFRGSISADGRLEGPCKWTPDSFQSGRFTLEPRTSSLAVLRSRPGPNTFAENRGRSLWKVARSGILQQMWSWTYFRERRDARKRFVDLYSRITVASQWFGLTSVFNLATEDHARDLNDLECSLSGLDRRLYRSTATRALEQGVIHYNISCNACLSDSDGYILGNVRSVCLTCLGPTLNDSVDLCAEHTTSRVPSSKHDSSHPILKARALYHRRDDVRLRNRAAEYCVVAGQMLPCRAQKPISESEVIPLDCCNCNMDLETGAVFSDVPDSVVPLRAQDAPSSSAAQCIGCEKIVHAPCYMCMDDNCNEDQNTTFLCEECERAENVSDWRSPTHAPAHLLLRIPVPTPKSTPDEVQSPQDALASRMLDLERRYTEHTLLIGQRLDGVDQRFDGVDQRFGGVDTRFDGVGEHFEGVDQHFDRVDRRFEVIDRRFDAIDERFSRLEKMFAVFLLILCGQSISSFF